MYSVGTACTVPVPTERVANSLNLVCGISTVYLCVREKKSIVCNILVETGNIIFVSVSVRRKIAS